jgi:hypothetical protein
MARAHAPDSTGPLTGLMSSVQCGPTALTLIRQKRRANVGTMVSQGQGNG